MAGLSNAEWGPVNAPVVVLLHGFMGSGDDWAPVAEALPEFRILAPDLPGHGRSTDLPEGAYTLTGAAELCAEFLVSRAARDGQLAVLAGYSMGGRVAQEILASRVLPTTTSLCLIGAHPGYQAGEEREQRLLSDQNLADRIEENFESTLSEWLALPMFSTLTPTQRQTLRRRRLSGCQPPELARSLRGMSTGNQPDRRHALAGAASRVRLVAGEKDERYVRLMSGLAPDTVTVKGAGHNVPLERPGVLAAILRDLALRQPGGGAGA